MEKRCEQRKWVKWLSEALVPLSLSEETTETLSHGTKARVHAVIEPRTFLPVPSFPRTRLLAFSFLCLSFSPVCHIGLHLSCITHVRSCFCSVISVPPLKLLAKQFSNWEHVYVNHTKVRVIVCVCVCSCVCRSLPLPLSHSLCHFEFFVHCSTLLCFWLPLNVW